MRVGIIALLQESNTFLAARTTLAHFEADLLAEGDDVRRRLASAHHEVGGFFAGLDEAGIEAVPIFAARALPFGVIAADAFDALMARLIGQLRRSGPLDGLLVAPHGATVSENYPDADGHWLTLVRSEVGPSVPIIGTLDLHGNLSPAMAIACDALIAYRTNPHLDQRQRGLDAARLMARTLRGDVRPVMAAEFLPLAVNIERQLTSTPPLKFLYEQADRMLLEPGVLSNSLMLGFPYADVTEMGAAVLVVSDGDPALARNRAAALARSWWERRAEFVGRLTSIDEAFAQAATLDGPIGLLDMGDNVGGGSPGDGTWLLHAWRASPTRRSAFACLADPVAVEKCRNAGIGGRLVLAMGGTSDPRHGEPFRETVEVLGLAGGKFEEPEPRHGGFTSFDQGPTAVVANDTGLTLMLTTCRMVPFSLRQLTAFGVDPARFHLLIAKGVHAPVAAYAPVCEHLIRVDTPGTTSADLGRFTYRRRRPLFPLDAGIDWSPRGTE
jgi:microcystin degradation protein MlrC